MMRKESDPKFQTALSELRIRFETAGRAEVLSLRELTAGSTELTRKLLNALVQEGCIYMVASGYYSRRLPDVSSWDTCMSLSRATARRNGVDLLPTPDLAARMLGLRPIGPQDPLIWLGTKAISAKVVRGRQICITLSRDRSMVFAGSPVGVVLQAVRAIGVQQALTKDSLDTIRECLSLGEREQLPADAKRLGAPDWFCETMMLLAGETQPFDALAPEIKKILLAAQEDLAKSLSSR